MIVNPERIFSRFAKVQNPDLIKNPVWQKYKQDFMDYFTQFENADEVENFNNVIFYPCLGDDLPSTPIDKHYFYQDTWASKKIFERKPESVLDIGSTVLYAGIISQFVSTTFVDIRPVNLNLPGLTVVDGSILDLPFADASQSFITSLGVIEHIGLGRYGDPIMPDGTQAACAEINRVLKAGGELVISVPLGKSDCIAFNAHRIFSKNKFLSYFIGYEILDEVYLNPEPIGAEILSSLDIGESIVWVVHLKKGIDREIENWIARSKPVPPPHKLKQKVVREFSDQFRIDILVETGTYLGDMVSAMRNQFKKIISIELGKKLYLRAKQKFSNYEHINIVQGDSGVLLPTIISTLNQPCLFWLDGHYSAGITAKGDLETPILQELDVIFNHSIKNHVILIDDARCFNGENDYPTIDELRQKVYQYDPSYNFEVTDDIIRVYPIKTQRFSPPHKLKAVPNQHISTSLSDNQTYPQVCIEVSNDYRLFNSFRRNLIYNEILEHVSENQGREYLNIISEDPDILSAINNFKLNDEYGSPIMYEYSGIGIISPTTLRYIKVLADLKKYFQTLNDLSICEIGVGYGGQCRVINAYYSPSMYCLVDIKPALSLAQRFLDNYIIHSVLTYKTMNELSQRDYDLVLSNYAFTELPRSVQDIYLNKVILRSKRGYITYNETTPSEFNSYKSSELIEIISGSRIFKEEPLTHPKNCIIVWGEDNA